MRGYSIVGLDNPKTLANLGSIMRGVDCFGSHGVYYSGHRTKFKRTSTDTQSAYRHTPITHVENLLDVIPFDCVPIAVDLTDNAIPIQRFEHPERAYYIFGSEDNTLGNSITEHCKQTIYIPTKYCLNLAVSVQTVLYDRMMKRKEYYTPKTLGYNE